MKVIGITGGVGAGKSTVLDLLKGLCKCDVIMADNVAKSLYNIGESAYQKIVNEFGEEILDNNKEIDKNKLATLIFANENNRNIINEIVHPLVKQQIINIINNHKNNNDVDYVFVEAALLIEDNYKTFLDEIWYIYASEDVRRARLSSSRNYSDEKIDSIFNSQLKEEDFRKASTITIDNGLSEEDTRLQLEKYVKM